MENSYQYFKNRECQYMPCHEGIEGDDFNCLFCYCPMYPYADCLGTPEFLKQEKGTIVKDCSGCVFPHESEHYAKIMEFLQRNTEDI